MKHDDLGARGREIWDSAETGDPAIDALVLEAARTADRLDEINRVIEGRGVLDLLQFRDIDVQGTLEDPDVRTINVTIRADGLLSEARQQASALNGLVTRILATRAGNGSPVAARPRTASAGDNVTPLERARRAAGKR